MIAQAVHRQLFAALVAVALGATFMVSTASAGTVVGTDCWSTELSIGQLGWEDRNPGPFSLRPDCPDYRFTMLGPAQIGEDSSTYAYVPSNLSALDVTVEGGPSAASGAIVTMQVCSMVVCGRVITPNLDGSLKTEHLTLLDGIPADPATLVIRGACLDHDLPDPEAGEPPDYMGMYGFVPDCFSEQVTDTVFGGLRYSIEDDRQPELSLTDDSGTPLGVQTPWLGDNPFVYVHAYDEDSFIAQLKYSFGDGEPEVGGCPRLTDGSFPLNCFSGQIDGLPIRVPDELTGVVPMHVEVTDGAGNTRSAKVNVRRDTTPPLAPTDLNVEGAANGWVPDAMITVRWASPLENAASDSESGVNRARWRLLDPDGVQLQTGTNDGEPPINLTTRLPGPGRYSLELSLIDRMGNESPPASLPVKLDQVVPSEPKVEVPPKVNAAVAASGAALRWKDPVYWDPAFSGICSYRVAINATPGFQPGASADVVVAPERSLELTPSVIAAVPDGELYFHLRAISCAGRIGRTGHTKLTVDRVAPVVLATPGGAGWQPPGTKLRLDVTDADPSSGVSSIAYSVDGGSVQTIEGASTVIELGQGMRTITYSAVDATGNRSGQKGIQLGIDSLAPLVAFDGSDPSDPALITARISDPDSAVADAWIEYRESESPSWIRMPGESAGDAPRVISARMPDDDSIPPGRYELHVIARDRAGNIAVVSSRVDGELATVELPLRHRPTLTLVLSKSASAPASGALLVPFGASVVARGSLHDARGNPVPGAEVTLAESVSGGPSRTIATSITDAAGQYSGPIPPGASRAITARFAGSPVLGSAAARSAFSVRGRVVLMRPARRVRSGAGFYLRGRVDPGFALLPRAGARIEIQHRSRGRWSGSVINGRTASDGSFATRLRFRTRGRPIRFTFRVAVVPEVGWPYATGFSQTRRVVVR